MGYSELTESLVILCAYIPESPVTPITAISTNTVVVTWIAPDPNGSPITEYTILLRNAADEFILELTDCDGRNAEIVANTQCIIPLTTLYVSPFDLQLGDSIDVMISASNIYGTSPYSPVGSGAQVVTVPDAPENFANVPEITNASRIGLTWSEPTNSGGEPILDYTIMYDQSESKWVELVNSVTETSYTTTALLTKGRSYTFKVQARNSVGFGVFCAEITILAAQIPDQPLAPTTAVLSNGLDLAVNWMAPDDGGSPITAYFIEIQGLDGEWYEE